MTLLEHQRQMREWLTQSIPTSSHREKRSHSGFNVYQNNYRAQLIACLEETYARVKAWIGDDAFRAAAARHIDENPPSHWSLDRYGADLPRTLGTLYPHDHEIAELAWLEHALSDAFVGPNAASLTPASASNIDWDATCLHFVPTLRLAQLKTNAIAIWSALNAKAPAPSVTVKSNPSTVIVWRKAFTACFREVSDEERGAMAHFDQGGTFGELCTTLVERHGESEGVATAASLLARWLQDELIAQTSARTEA